MDLWDAVCPSLHLCMWCNSLLAGDEEEAAAEGEDTDGQVPAGHHWRHGSHRQEQEEEGSGGRVCPLLREGLWTSGRRGAGKGWVSLRACQRVVVLWHCSCRSDERASCWFQTSHMGVFSVCVLCQHKQCVYALCIASRASLSRAGIVMHYVGWSLVLAIFSVYNHREWRGIENIWRQVLIFAVIICTSKTKSMIYWQFPNAPLAEAARWKKTMAVFRHSMSVPPWCKGTYYRWCVPPWCKGIYYR